MKTQTQRRTRKREKGKQGAQRTNTGAVAPRKSGPATYIWCVALATLTFAVYLPAIFHPFVNYDDNVYVWENRHVQDGLSASTFTWAMTALDGANWHPVTWLSHALDCQLYGLNPHGHHLTSVLLHAMNVVLLFLILQWGTGATWRSAVVAALFGLHPLNVESVAWVAERKNVLSTFFFLLTLAAYGRYARRPSWGGYLVVALAFALGLAAKPMLVTLPFVLLLLDYWPLARIEGWSEPSSNPQASWQRLLLEKLPLLGLSAASSALTVIAQEGAVRQFVTLPTRLGNAVNSYVKYILKVFWPAHLAVIYPHPLNKLSAFAVLASAVFLTGISLLVWRWRKEYPFAIVSWFWFLGTLVPVIGIVQVGDQAMADRYMYIPAIGIFVGLVWSLDQWTAAQAWFSSSWVSVSLKGIFAILLVALSLVTIHQIGYWRDPIDLWTHTLEITDDNFVAEDHLGGLLVREGRIDEANRLFEAAARVAPLDPISHTGLAAAAQDRGDLQEAIRDYEVGLNSNDPQLVALNYANLSIVFRQLGDYPSARENSIGALHYNPEIFQLMIQQSVEGLQSAPQASGYLRLGFLYEGSGQIAEAESAFQRALQLDPADKPARKALEEISSAR
jgi:protein O-mannosyl-transferase